MPRDTTTGAVLERMILLSLSQGGYSYETQKNIGFRPGGGKHNIDVIALKSNQKILVSLKWQQSSGTAEQKVPFEVMSLLDAMSQEKSFIKSYLVLGGSGWKLRDFYTSGEMNKYLDYSGKVEILTLEDFIAKANKGIL